MTIKDAGNLEIPTDEQVGAVEEIAKALAEVEAEKAVRHLAIGVEPNTLCGIPRGGGIITVHPSKSKKNDCAACREARAERNRKARIEEKFSAPPESIETVEMPTPTPTTEIAVEVLDLSTKPFPPATEPIEPPRKYESARRWNPTEEEKAEVRRRRALGESFGKIEKAMGWPDGHGNRPYLIMKGRYDGRKS